MSVESTREILQFGNDWFAIGIINDEALLRHEQEYNKGEDPHPEHYRYRAFMDFLKANSLLEASKIKALYRLGENEPDYEMGGSMIVALLKRAECPHDLLLSALESDRAYIQRAAKRRLEEQL